ncbi:MAG: anhydro-N-acetylmuramic acid kinase, partial [Bacteroidota bacterium]|nr:anhydro-N-acetylmuramic acid kinase [Bacteroidota bacterium]
MNSTTYLMLGVMSGTSLDGIDLAYVRFTKTKHWQYELLSCETIPYETEWVTRLQNAVDLPQSALAS